MEEDDPRNAAVIADLVGDDATDEQKNAFDDAYDLLRSIYET